MWPSSSTSRDFPPFAGKYAFDRVLGQGGMGVVFAARHLRLGHEVAIKVLGRTARESPDAVRRFEREARTAGALASPHAVRVLDIDATDDQTPYIVMELLRGEDLGSLLRRTLRLPVDVAARFILEACDAVEEAHRRGIIHRDLKPSNLFLAEGDGRRLVKVLDFGVAKDTGRPCDAALTQDATPLGTPQYMAPEQVRSAAAIDGRADVWSLGVTLYELVTGRTPFAHTTGAATIAAVVCDPVPDPRLFRPELPAELVEVVARALQKDPRDRFATVGELARALAPFARDALTLDGVVPTSSPPDERRPRAFVEDPPRRRVPRAFAVALGLAGIAALPARLPAAHGASRTPRVAEIVAASELVSARPASAPASAGTAESLGGAGDLGTWSTVSRDLAPRRQARSEAPLTATKRRREADAGPSAAPRAHGGLSGPGF